jgi:neutral ceramidase
MGVGLGPAGGQAVRGWLYAVGLGLSAPASALTAGAGRADVALPQDLLPFQHFAVQHDALQARVLVMAEGDRRVGVVVVDLTSIFPDEIAAIRAIVQQAAQVRPDDVLVIASHTFSAPHIPPAGEAGPWGDPAKNAAFRDAFNAAVRAAATQAAQLHPATVAFGSGTSDTNVNRNVLTRDGWWLGADDSGASDKTVGVVRIDDAATHRPIATLVNYAVQSAIMNQSVVQDGGTAITGDVAGATVRRVESQLGGDALFLVGAAGDQVPTYTAQRNVVDADGSYRMVDIGAAAYPLIDLIGERLGDAATGAAQSARPGQGHALQLVNAAIDLPKQDRPRQIAQLSPHKTYEYKVTGTQPATYSVLRVGDLAIVGVAVELSAATGAAIRAHSPFAHTLVVTMVNGAAKYLPDADSYRRITYQAMNSSYAPGGAETLATAIGKTLQALKSGR